MERITVLENVEGKFGKQLKDSKGYLSFGKFYKGPQEFTLGAQLDVDLFVTTKGNRYINSASVIAPGVTPETPKKTKKVKETMEQMKTQSVETCAPKGRDYDKENRGKVKSLFLEALLSNPNVIMDTMSIANLNGLEVQAQLNKLVESVF